MEFNKEEKTLGLIWVCVLLTVFMLSIFLHDTFQQNFKINRLVKIKNNGIVAFGTSLIHNAFPYDDYFDQISKQAGLSLQFVRFFWPSGVPSDFEILLQPILAAKPKWIFMQAEPFVLDYNQTGIHLPEEIHAAFKKIIFKLPEYYSQDDSILNLDVIAHSIEGLGMPVFRSPRLSVAYRKFIMATHQAGIHLVLLRMNRSLLANQMRGKDFVMRENLAFEVLKNKYGLELWEFPSLPLQYYTDGGHLNRQGRQVFIHWMIARLKNESLRS